MEFWIWLLLTGIVGMVIGYGICAITRRKNPVGTLREDNSDPAEGPYLFLELEPGAFEVIHQSKTVLLNVKIENYLPRE